jgi:hypothetical protein
LKAGNHPQHRSEKNEDASLNYVRHEPGTGHGSVRAVAVDGAVDFDDHPEPAGFNDDHHDAVGVHSGAEFDRHRHFHQPVHDNDSEHELDVFDADALTFAEPVAGSDHAFIDFDVDVQSCTRQHQSGTDAEHAERRQDGAAAEHAAPYSAVFRDQRQCVGQHQ